jgi:hypothetical protein
MALFKISLATGVSQQLSGDFTQEEFPGPSGPTPTISPKRTHLVYMADQNAGKLFELFAVNLVVLEGVSENGEFCFSLPTNDNKGLVYSCL